MHENFYDEVVVVRNGIGFVVNEHVMNAMLGMNYEYVGLVQDTNKLKNLLNEEKEDKLSLDVQKHTISLEELLKEKLEKTEQEETYRPYIENLE